MAVTKRALLTVWLIAMVSSSVETANSFPGLSVSALNDAARQQSPETAPREWIDPATGHRVLRLSDKPGSASLYFHQNQYTADGARPSTICSVLRVLRLIADSPSLVAKTILSKVVVGRKTRQVFYMVDDTVYATHLDTKATRTIARRPELRAASGFAVNADESLLAGSYVEGEAVRPQSNPPVEANLIPQKARGVL